MRILGIDPGYAILGYGVLDKIGNKFVTVAYGSITTDSKMEMPERLVALYDGLTGIIQTYKPDEASIEELFFNNNAKTAILVGEARGVAVLACAKQGLKISEYTPLQIKQALVGYRSPMIRRTPSLLQSATGTAEGTSGRFGLRREFKNDSIYKRNLCDDF